MRLWMIWAVLAVIWALQAGAAALVHRSGPALVMLGLAVFFGLIGSVVRRRTAGASAAVSSGRAKRSV